MIQIYIKCMKRTVTLPPSLSARVYRCRNKWARATVILLRGDIIFWTRSYLIWLLRERRRRQWLWDRGAADTASLITIDIAIERQREEG